MSRLRDEPQQLPLFELKVIVRPVGFDQRTTRFHNGQYTVQVRYEGEGKEVDSGQLSWGPDLDQVIAQQIVKVLKSIAEG
jgi:hypothetical protein